MQLKTENELHYYSGIAEQQADTIAQSKANAAGKHFEEHWSFSEPGP